MVWYFIGVYIIHRTLHGCLEIQNLSSSVEKIFQHSKGNFVSPSSLLYISIYIPFTSPSCKSKNEEINRNMLLHTYTIVKKSCCDRHTLGGPTVLNDLLYKTLQWVLLQVSPNKITFHSWNLLHVWNLNGLRSIDCHLQSVSYFCIQIRRERKELRVVSFQSCFNCNQVLQYFCWKPALKPK